MITIIETIKNFFKKIYQALYGERHEADSRVLELEREVAELKKNKETMKAQLDEQLAIKGLYQETGDEIRHYSNIRWVLTTLLITIAVACFSGYFSEQWSHLFMLVIGFLFLIAALAACLNFSYRTEKKVIEYKRLSDMLLSNIYDNVKSAYSLKNFKFNKNSSDDKASIWNRIFKDKVNWLLTIAILFITIVVFYFINLDSLIESTLDFLTPF